MTKAILFLADGMADEPLPELGNKTPLEYAFTPNMDRLASEGANGTFLSLPAGFPTSSDVANMSILGYDLAKYYPGRGPIEAMSQGIKLAADDVAWRLNLVYTDGEKLIDFSAGHIENERSKQIIADLQRKFGSDKIIFHHGVSYRNLLVTHGPEFTPGIISHKPDATQGQYLKDLRWQPADKTKESVYTAEFLNSLVEETADFLKNHPANHGAENPANSIWPHSPGRNPSMPRFTDKYNGKKGAVISAVDVILGLAICTGMDIVKVPGATGFIDTNYKGKAEAAVKALEDHDFVYLHVEAIDECSHMGDLKLKLKAIEDFDAKIVGPVMKAFYGRNDISFALLPDHPVPIKLRSHTRAPVPLAVKSPFVKPDTVNVFSERAALTGSLGQLKGDELMKLLLNMR